jgi:hypothetical protein
MSFWLNKQIAFFGFLLQNKQLEHQTTLIMVSAKIYYFFKFVSAEGETSGETLKAGYSITIYNR